MHHADLHRCHTYADLIKTEADLHCRQNPRPTVVKAHTDPRPRQSQTQFHIFFFSHNFPSYQTEENNTKQTKLLPNKTEQRKGDEITGIATANHEHTRGGTNILANERAESKVTLVPIKGTTFLDVVSVPPPEREIEKPITTRERERERARGLGFEESIE